MSFPIFVPTGDRVPVSYSAFDALTEVTGFSVTEDFEADENALAWTNPTDVDFDHVEIYEAEDDYPATPGTGRLVYSGSGTSFVDSAPGFDTHHYYSIWAADGFGNYSDTSDTTLSEPMDVPADITDFTLVDHYLDEQVGLSWTNPPEDFDHVEIYMKATPPSAPGDGTLLYSGSLEAHFATIDYSAEHYYAIWAFNVANGYSENPGTAWSGIMPAPDAITDFALNQNYTDQENELSWTNPDQDQFDHVEIYELESGYPTYAEPGARLVYSGSGESFHDAVVFDADHYYTIWACNSVGGVSTADQAKSDEAGLPNPVTDLALESDAEAGTNTLTWTNPGGFFLRVEIYASTTGYPTTPGEDRLVYSGALEEVVDSGLDLDVNHYYAIWSVNPSEQYSETADTVASGDVIGPSPVTSLVATKGPGSITLTWLNPTTSDFAATAIRRSTTGYPATPSEGTAFYRGTAEEITDTDVVYGTTYYYSAWAQDEVPNNSTVEQVTATPDPNYGTAARVPPVGLIQATTQIIGESDTEIGGFRLTRLTAPVTAGEDTFPVETTLDWDESGKIGVEGVLYSYAGKTLTSFTGITYSAGGVAATGARMGHHTEAPVADCSRTWSAIDRCRRAMLIDYAEGEYLNVCARNLGVNRLPLFASDDQFREVVKAVAYNPKGTTYGLEMALDAILGAGNYEIWEDLISHPCIVYIYVPMDEILDTSYLGKAYLNAAFYGLTSGAGFDTVVLDHPPLWVGTVRLLDLDELFDFRTTIPGSLTYLRHPDAETAELAFSWTGYGDEADSVRATGGITIIQTMSNIACWEMSDVQGARVTSESDWEVNLLFKLDPGAHSTTRPDQWSVSVHDGDQVMSFGTLKSGADFRFGLYADPTGGFLGAYFTATYATWYEVALKKTGSTVELWVDGDLVDSADYSDFSAETTTDHKIAWGAQYNPGANLAMYVKQLGAQIRTGTDYWDARGDTGSVATANPTRFTDGATLLAAGDVGSYLEISGSAVANTQGGNNNGLWKIASLVSPGVVTLAGDAHPAEADFLDTYPKRITVDSTEGFLYPDDLGKQIIITDSAVGNDGTYVIEKLLHPLELTELGDGDEGEYTHICEVVSATFASELRASYQLIPVFVTESGLSWVLSDAGSLSDDTLTLRQGLWDADLLVRVGIEDMISAQLVPNSEVVNELLSEDPEALRRYYPFYLYNPFAVAEAYLDQITAAGVLTQFVTVDESGMVRLVGAEPDGPLALRLTFSDRMAPAGLLSPESYGVSGTGAEGSWSVETEIEDA